MNKICTSIEQSKKLIKLGIDINTADMFYADLLVDGRHNYYLHSLESYGFKTFEETKLQTTNRLGFIPAWSLGTLMGLMPRVGDSFPELCRGKETGLFYMWLDEEFDTQKYSNPIDAAVEMICWLKENKKL